MPEEEDEVSWTFEFEGRIEFQTMLLVLIVISTVLMVTFKPGLLHGLLFGGPA
ncbi:hypothetical protein ACBY01_01355 [Sphingomonas sp. ac-8]|uniref:hypothetical protein n=1 Tax=Sphingomonas sp. ac-8 TaxID=3242977 RepID=UPI003A806829